MSSITRCLAKFAPVKAGSDRSPHRTGSTKGKKYPKAWAWFVGLYCVSLLALGAFEAVSHWLVAVLGRY
jgi:hypothetical protein